MDGSGSGGSLAGAAFAAELLRALSTPSVNDGDRSGGSCPGGSGGAGAGAGGWGADSTLLCAALHNSAPCDDEGGPAAAYGELASGGPRAAVTVAGDFAFVEPACFSAEAPVELVRMGWGSGTHSCGAYN
jgi:hypothetical protein